MSQSSRIILDTSHRAFIDTTTLEKQDFILVRFPYKSLCWLHVSGHGCTVKAASEAAGSTSQVNGTVFCAIDSLSRLRLTAPGMSVLSPKKRRRRRKVKTSLFPYVIGGGGRGWANPSNFHLWRKCPWKLVPLSL